MKNKITAVSVSHGLALKDETIVTIFRANGTSKRYFLNWGVTFLSYNRVIKAIEPLRPTNTTIRSDHLIVYFDLTK